MSTKSGYSDGQFAFWNMMQGYDRADALAMMDAWIAIDKEWPARFRTNLTNWIADWVIAQAAAEASGETLVQMLARTLPDHVNGCLLEYHLAVHREDAVAILLQSYEASRDEAHKEEIVRIFKRAFPQFEFDNPAESIIEVNRWYQEYHLELQVNHRYPRWPGLGAHTLSPLEITKISRDGLYIHRSTPW